MFYPSQFLFNIIGILRCFQRIINIETRSSDRLLIYVCCPTTEINLQLFQILIFSVNEELFQFFIVCFDKYIAPVSHRIFRVLECQEVLFDTQGLYLFNDFAFLVCIIEFGQSNLHNTLAHMAISRKRHISRPVFGTYLRMLLFYLLLLFFAFYQSQLGDHCEQDQIQCKLF